MNSVSNNESHYTVWTTWTSVCVRVRVGFKLQNLAPPGNPLYVLEPPSVSYSVLSCILNSVALL